MTGSTTPLTFPFVSFRSTSIPAVAATGEARFYFNHATGKLCLSQNGQPYIGLDLFDGVHKNLDNLSTITAINSNLLGASDNTVSLGSLAKRFSSLTIGPQFLNIASLPSESGTGRTWKLGIQLSAGTAQGSLRIFLDGAPNDAINLNPTGNMGLGTTTPTTILDMAGALTLRGMLTPVVAPVGQGRIFFDTTTNRFRASENGLPYVDLIGGGEGGAGDAGTVFDIYICPPGAVVGDAVGILIDDTVDIASSEAGGLRAIGVISFKPSSNTAVVVSAGPVAVYTTLIVGSSYYLSTAGALTTTPPIATDTNVQYMGTATTATKLMVSVDPSGILN